MTSWSRAGPRSTTLETGHHNLCPAHLLGVWIQLQSTFTCFRRHSSSHTWRESVRHCSCFSAWAPHIIADPSFLVHKLPINACLIPLVHANLSDDADRLWLAVAVHRSTWPSHSRGLLFNVESKLNSAARPHQCTFAYRLHTSCIHRTYSFHPHASHAPQSPMRHRTRMLWRTSISRVQTPR